MKILDIDLDFFLDEIALHRSDFGQRLENDEYIPWKGEDVDAFLRERCGLTKNKKIKGRIINHHHEAFFFWRELIESGDLNVPFSVTHIDAHADLGLGDGSWHYLMTEFLHLDVNDRRYPEKYNEKDLSKLNFGNYLAYSIACQWLSSLTYVTHPRWRNDLPWTILKDFSDHSKAIQLKKYELGIKLDVMNMDKYTPVQLEPEVPLKIIQCSEYIDDGNFDFILLCKSPGYTPKTSDKLIPIISEYFDFI
ncbi:UPF0489 family protein [Paenibacillus frigoriresistens]|uniref:UPF0489 family protein n=1 Tax=Paenibacillus alginolyticus TaxID=59839 RepID=UPI001563B88E|nr:UPF0489 family protein [Paenibacillus frigoriresistens]NRF89864.1 UPF0489 family protein [Paenibacillus frigoriresistens]